MNTWDDKYGFEAASQADGHTDPPTGEYEPWLPFDDDLEEDWGGEDVEPWPPPATVPSDEFGPTGD